MGTELGQRSRSKSSPGRWVLVVAAALAGGLGFVPGFGGPQYPSGLVLGLCLPSVVGVGIALAGTLPGEDRSAAFRRGLRTGFFASVLAFTILSLHALVQGLCDYWYDSLCFWLGPGLGPILSGGVGATVAHLTGTWQSSRLIWVSRVVGGLGWPLFGFGRGLYRFITTPAVFAFDEHVGYFAGSLYDTRFDPRFSLMWFRLGTLGAVVGLDGLLRLHRPWPFERGPASRSRWIALAGFSLFVLVGAAGERLHHRGSTETIARELGGSVQSGRCLIWHGQETNAATARLLAEDCTAYLVRLERRLGITSRSPVTVFVFDDGNQKARLMGAQTTQIAKPWRREIYLDRAGYPHPVMGHELAHVVVGEIAPGPFGVPGGLLPNPGLTEGLAVALAPDSGDLSLEEAARALQLLNRHPTLTQLFSLGFLAESSRVAYTAAGAFVAHLLRVEGAEKLRSWVAGHSIHQVYGRDLGALEQRYLSELAAIQLSDQALLHARNLFARPALFRRRCPYAVDRLLDQAWSEAGGPECSAFRRVLEHDPKELRTRLALGLCLGRSGKQFAAQLLFEELASEVVRDPVLSERVAEALADLALVRHHFSESRAQYQELAERAFDTDRRRSLALRASVESPEGARAVLALISPNSDRGTSKSSPTPELLAWSEVEPDAPAPRYWIGRQAYFRGDYPTTLDTMRELIKWPDLPRTALTEVLRLAAISACALGDYAAVAEYARGFVDADDVPWSRRLRLADFVDRCTDGRLVLTPASRSRTDSR